LARVQEEELKRVIMTAGGGVYMKEVEYRETVDFKGKIEAFTKINTFHF